MRLIIYTNAFLCTATLIAASPYPSPERTHLRRDALANPLSGRHSHWHGWPSIRRLFVFGDSYTSNGFNPHGVQPNATRPDGRSALNSSSADGSNWAEYLTETYNQSFVRLYDMAQGGAAVNKTLTREIYEIVADFNDQVHHKFLPNYYTTKQIEWSNDHSLFATFFGINDVISANGHPTDTLFDEIFASYRNGLETLYTAGARNFLLLKVPAVNRSPGFSLTAMGACDGAALHNSLFSWNSRVDRLAFNLTLSHQDTTVFVFDTERVFNKVLDYPQSYEQTSGLTHLTDYCSVYSDGTPNMNQTYNSSRCAAPVNQYFWLNGLHPTWAIHSVMAQEIVQVLNGSAFGQVVV